MSEHDLTSRGSAAETPTMLNDISKLTGVERVHEYLKWCLGKAKDPENQDWMANIMPYLEVHSHSSAMPHPRLSFRFTVQPIHCNQLNNLHGGCTATIFDIATTLPLHLINKPGFWMYLGVSRTLNTTYLKPIPCGTTIDILCEILSIGKRLCTLKGEMREVNDDGSLGALLAVCEHGKVSVDPQMQKL